MSDLKIYHSSGFFSCCTIRLRSIIYYYTQTGKFPVVDSSLQWVDYKDNNNEDVTNYFFKTTGIEKEINFSEFSESGGDQFNDYSKINYQDVNFFVEKYFSPSDEVLKIKNDIINSYNIDVDKTISVCYRGNDKVNETKIPSYDEILLKIIEIKSRYPTHRLLIQSDEIEFCDFILDKFPDSLIIKETKKINKTTTNLVGNVQRSTPVGERVRTAQTFLAVMYLMSETSYVIMNSGNVGLWICYFRGNSNNISQYLDKDSYTLYNIYEFRCSFNGENIFSDYTYNYFPKTNIIEISKPNLDNWF
jgi:hypothetical protein